MKQPTAADFTEKDIELIVEESYQHWQEILPKYENKRMAFLEVFENVFAGLITYCNLPLRKVDPFTFAIDLHKMLDAGKREGWGINKLKQELTKYMHKELNDYAEMDALREEQKQTEAA